MDFRPDPAGPPVYIQLATALAEAIRAGRMAVGSRLPSERMHARRLGVSRTTITAAYQELKAMGLVQAHVGRGAQVVADDPDRAAAEAVAWPLLAARAPRPPPPPPAPPGAIGFGDGWLHPSLLPRAGLDACAARAVEAGALAGYAPILGLPALRESLAARMKLGVEEVLVTGGAQQGLNVITRALLAPGDAVVCESPTWHGAVRAFRAAGAELAGVAMDREGIDPGALEDALLRRRPKFVYLIPSFHCPTGRLLGLERRRQVLELCARFRTPIVESHVYGELAFGAAPPSLKALDTAGIVIHQGSASKTISAALRLGWLAAPPAALALLAPAKASLDLSTPALPQAILAGFLAGSQVARHFATLRAALQRRRDAMLAALARHCPELRCAVPQGGLYLWAQLPTPLAAGALEAEAARHGVAVRAGGLFLPAGGESRHIRLCFAAPAEAEIADGAERLGRALRGLMARKDAPCRESAVAAV
jgi:DNA-binding transcriptional MocR family regulator